MSKKELPDLPEQFHERVRGIFGDVPECTADDMNMIIHLEIRDYHELKVITELLLNRIIQEHRPALTEEKIYWVISELKKELSKMTIVPGVASDNLNYNEEDIIQVATQVMKHQFYTNYGHKL